MAHQERGERLRHDQLPGDVHVELLPELVDGDVQQRTGPGDAGIVDEAEENLVAERVSDLRRRGFDGRLVGHVEADRRERGSQLRLQTIGVGPGPHAAEDAEACPQEHCGGTVPDPRGDARDDDRFHVCLCEPEGIFDPAGPCRSQGSP